MKRTDVLISLALMAFAIAVVVLALTIAPHAANAQQHDHGLYHAFYEKWQSNTLFNCCEDRHCGVIAEDHLRESEGHMEVLVEDPSGNQWCPVKWEHMIDQTHGLKRSPDWTQAHACILDAQSWSTYAPCERFKCFMDKARD